MGRLCYLGTQLVQTSEEGEVNELVDFDGTMQSSKIPVGTELNKTISPKKTTDDTIKMANQSLSMMGTGGGSGTYFRRYYKVYYYDF